MGDGRLISIDATGNQKYVGQNNPLPTQPTNSLGQELFTQSNPGNTQIMGSKYQDLGQIISGTNMAAGAFVYSNYITNVAWVRNLVIFTQSDQQYDYGLYRQDSSGNNDVSGITISSGQTANGAAWRGAAINGTNAILGYGAKFFIKNSSASANTFANMRVQLLGQ
jgi:hypothetical protein